MPQATIPVSDSGGHVTNAVVPIAVSAGTLVAMGVNSRYFDDFVTKVAAVKNERFYAASQSPPNGSNYVDAKNAAAAGITPWLTFKSTPTTSFLNSLRSWILTLARRPVIDYYHEPDDNLSASTYITNARLMSNAIKDVADISWCPRALNFGNPGPQGFTAEQYWPGDSYIDIAACDGYFKDKFPYGTPDDIYKPSYDFAIAHGKKWAVLEWGVQSNFPGVTPSARAACINNFANWLVPRAANIESLLYWESGPPQVANDYQLRDDPIVRQAYQDMLARPEFAPDPHPV